jgi:hypothetical protein
MKHLLLLLTCYFVSTFAFAQIDTSQVDGNEDDDTRLVIPAINEQLKAGVKIGGGLSVLLGDELQNPVPTYLLTGGAYIRWRFKPHWNLQPEFNITYRGSKFNNGNLEYQEIVMYSLDIPVLLMYGFNEQNTSNIVAGIQYSRLLNSSLYLTDALVSENTAPALTKNDLMVVAGAQFHTPFVGFQILAKYGLIDMNNGLLPNLNPPNTGKSIHPFLLEINLLF